MRILGLDVGQRRIGVAGSDPLGITAQGVTVVQRKQWQQDRGVLGGLAKRYGAEKIVLGLPLDRQGKRGAQAQRVMAFGESLRQTLKVPIEWVDERFTTAQSQQALKEMGIKQRKGKSVIDQMAAQLILQSYLDATR